MEKVPSSEPGWLSLLKCACDIEISRTRLPCEAVNDRRLQGIHTGEVFLPEPINLS